MSFQRPTNIVAGPSSASYSEFLKDIYSSLRNLTAGLNLINQRLDNLQQQLQSFDTRLVNQDQMAQNLATRLDTLIQRTENQQIRQTTTGLNLLSELDNLGSREVEPSTGLAELGLWTEKRLAPVSLLSKLSFQLPGILEELPELPGILGMPDIIVHEPSPTNDNHQGQQFNGPSTTTTPATITTATTNINSNPGPNSEPAETKPQLGTNFLILD